MKKEALFYIKKNDNIIECNLCHNNCVIIPGQYGLCGVRQNIDGKLFAMTYGRFCSVEVDPIEKKPLYHFYPNKDIISLGSIGCNYKCFFCQNHDISQKKYDEILSLSRITSEDILKISDKYDVDMVAFTYNEPLIMYEYLVDTLPVLYSKGIKTVLVTNGSISSDAAKNILPYISAVNIDLKGFSEEFYKKYCFGNLDYVKKIIKLFFQNKIHFELTNLLIPSLNDDIDSINNMINWIASMSDEIPLHFSKYFPRYKSKIQETDIQFMIDVYHLASKKLKYVYLGNAGLSKYSSTFCPNCKKEIINRSFYTSFNIVNDNGLCPECDYKISGEF